MPLIVDKAKMRTQILDAFEKCIEDKPLSNITLRDIAKKANMSHPKLLNYYASKKELIVAYCQYTQEYMTDHCKLWFEQNKRTEYESNVAYMNAFIQYVAAGKKGEIRPNATVQTYVLAQYDKQIRTIVQEEFKTWRKEMQRCLVEIYGTEAGAKEAEAMMILITGIFICHYTGALTGAVNDTLLELIDKLVTK